MKHFQRGALAAIVLLAFFADASFAADAKAGTLTCVGLYSETSDGYVSYRATAKAEWTPVKVGDELPAGAEVKINVDRDWVEFIRTGSPNAVFEIIGPESGELVKSVADILKGKSRSVAFPKGSAAKPDSKYKDKLVVTQYLGRQIYVGVDGVSKDVKYGDVLDQKGKVKIIAINNTITLMNASGEITKVVGPLSFSIDSVLTNKNLYKFLNVQK
jgi:hypothetical protein